MFCECGGVLDVIRVEKPPTDLPGHERLVYNRVCDVQCLQCGKVYYSQPYDWGSKFNIVKKIEDK